MFCCLLKKELTFTLSRLGTNYVSFSQVKFLVFEAQPVFSKLSEAAPLNERDRISITSTPSLHYRTIVIYQYPDSTYEQYVYMIKINQVTNNQVLLSLCYRLFYSNIEEDNNTWYYAISFTYIQNV